MTYRSLVCSLALATPAFAQPSLIGVSPSQAGGTQSTIYAIETMPFAASTLQAVNTPALSGLAIQPETATLFASGGGRSNGMLFRIDRQTGALTTIGATGFARVPGLAFAPDGVLYGTAESTNPNVADTLIQIDPVSGVGTQIGPLMVGNVGGIAFNPQIGLGYAVTTEVPPVLHTFDANTGATMLEGTITGITNDQVVGLTIDCAGRAWGSTAGGAIYRISLANYAATRTGLASTNGIADIAALRSPNLASGCGTAGGTICDSSSPRIGTIWEVSEADGGCAASRFMLVGLCNSTGLPISVVECASCTGCRLHVLPIFTNRSWNYEFTLPIPNDAGIVGLNFCVQNACLDAAMGCLCLSNTLSATVK